VITRNNPAPVMLIQGGRVQTIDEPSEVVGSKRGTRPHITEVPLQPGLAAVVFTDGLTHAGEREGRPPEVGVLIEQLLAYGPPDPNAWADRLVSEAVERDQGRPCDDISVLVAAILPEQADDRRRLLVRMGL
jgi:serine/threonine protein phosphatase PrpC